MQDKYNRNINYLRISVTNRCNLQCFYCASDGLNNNKPCSILTPEEIESIATEASKIGINKIRLTGGEPLIRDDIDLIIYKLSKINKIKHIAMTTNAILLDKKILGLKKSGLNSINISLDTLDPDKYRKITNGGNITRVFDGLKVAINNNIDIKINMVVIKDLNVNEIPAMQEFCDQKNIKLQLINHFNLHQLKTDTNQYDRPPKCIDCNRIRLLSNGFLKSCLHSEEEYKLDKANIKESLIKTIQAKPKNGLVCNTRQMLEIGG